MAANVLTDLATFGAIAAALYLLLKIHRQLKWILTSRLDRTHLQHLISQNFQQVQARAYLCNLLALPQDALPPMGGWAASSDFLLLIAEHILRHKPLVVVEFGSGVSTLVLGRCLQLNHRGKLLSFEHDEEFAKSTRDRASRLGLDVDIKVVSLGPAESLGYQGRWYVTPDIPDVIDLIIIDGPPILYHPETRGAAASLFSRLRAGGAIFLDDAIRSGEKAIAKLWESRHPQIVFRLIDTEKGTLIGHRAGSSSSS